MKPSSTQESPVLYREVQRFSSPLIIGAMIFTFVLVGGIMGWGLYQQLVLGVPWGDKPVPSRALVPLAVGSIMVSALPILLLLILRLETTLTASGLRLRLAPFANRLIPLEEIAEAKSRQYRPIREFGGWGVRFTMSGDRAYNAAGDLGVQLVLKDGKRVLVGSRSPEELEIALRAAAPWIS